MHIRRERKAMRAPESYRVAALRYIRLRRKPRIAPRKSPAKCRRGADYRQGRRSPNRTCSKLGGLHDGVLRRAQGSRRSDRPHTRPPLLLRRGPGSLPELSRTGVEVTIERLDPETAY